MNYTKAALAVSSTLGVRELIDALENFQLDELLAVIGLERRASSAARLLPAIGLVTLSAAVGAGAALLLAPSSGGKLRAHLSDGLGQAKHRLSDAISQFEHPHHHGQDAVPERVTAGLRPSPRRHHDNT